MQDVSESAVMIGILLLFGSVRGDVMCGCNVGPVVLLVRRFIG